VLSALAHRPWWPYFLLTLGVFFLATDVIVGRLADARAVPPFGLGFWRVMGPALLLTPFYGRELYAKRATVRRHWPILAVLGFCISALGGSAIYLGLSLTSAVNAGIVLASQSAVMALLGWAIFRDRIAGRQALGLAIAAAGVLAVVARGDIGVLLALQPRAGDLLVLAGVVGYAAYIVLVRVTPADLSPYARLCVVSWFGALFAAPLYAWEAVWATPFAYTAASLAMIAWISVVVTIVAIGCLTVGALRVGAYASSQFFYVRTVFVAALAILVLGETVAPYHIAGLLLICAGIWLMQARRRRPG
jgi:drug/metabolite transporter (DMT)-like permease